MTSSTSKKRPSKNDPVGYWRGVGAVLPERFLNIFISDLVRSSPRGQARSGNGGIFTPKMNMGVAWRPQHRYHANLYLKLGMTDQTRASISISRASSLSDLTDDSDFQSERRCEILLISSAFNSMTQRFYVELADNGYEVAVELYGGNENLLKESVSLYAPDLIIAPFLTRAIPMEIWGCHVCIIVHPGIEGDPGPSSLDWAIQERWEIWGVTLLQAVAEMDAGPIWASRTFLCAEPPRAASIDAT